MHHRRVAVGVIVYNSSAEAEGTVRACLRSDHGDFSITILDNGSTDGSGDVLRAAFAAESRVRVVRRSPNAGFAGGFNALRDELLQTDAEYAWILADDVRVAPDAMRLLVDALERDPAVGLAGPTLFRAQEPDRVYFSGGWMKLDDPDAGWVEVGHEHAGEVDEGEITSGAARECAWITGASMFFRAIALRDAGGMESAYWLYFEDVDLSWKVREAGWTIAIVPASRAWHDVTPEGDASTMIRVRYTTRNRLHFIVRRRGLAARKLAVRSLIRLLRDQGVYALVRPWRGVVFGTLDFLMGRTGPIRGSW